MDLTYACYWEKFRENTLSDVLHKLDTRGVVTREFLRPPLTALMVEEAKKLSYQYLPTSMSNGLVHQEIEQSLSIPRDNIFHQFASVYEYYWHTLLKQCATYPFDTPLAITDIVIQRYRKGSLGITPHIDGRSQRNLVSLFILEGSGDFFLCDDRTKKNSDKVLLGHGRIILMRANGFRNHTNTPFHYLENIRSDRYVLCLRQKV